MQVVGSKLEPVEGSKVLASGPLGADAVQEHNMAQALDNIERALVHNKVQVQAHNIEQVQVHSRELVQVLGSKGREQVVVHSKVRGRE